MNPVERMVKGGKREGESLLVTGAGGVTGATDCKVEALLAACVAWLEGEVGGVTL